MIFFTWPFDPKRNAIVAGYGFWLTVVGFALTIFGLFLTWRQLRKTQNATAAVEAELHRIQIAIASYDAAHEISRAIEALDATRRHLRNAAWQDVADGYEVFRRSLLITANILSLDQETLAGVEQANKYVLKLCQRIEVGIYSEVVSIDPAKTISMIRQHDELAGKLKIIIQKRAIS